jgi:hypothetical protein
MTTLIAPFATQAQRSRAVNHTNLVQSSVTRQGGLTMFRHLCGALLALWTIALVPLGIAFLMSFHWDHSFGHAPVAFWTFCGFFLLFGFALFKGSRPPKTMTAK